MRESKEAHQLIMFHRLCDIHPALTRANNEMGFSQVFSELFYDELAYQTSAKKWMYFDGVRWREDPGGTQAALRARDMQELLYLYATKVIRDFDERDDFIESVANYGSLHKRETLVRDARSLMAVTHEDFDNKPYLLNCLNCTIDLRTMEIYDQKSEDMLSKVCGCNYDKDADGTKWQKFIREIMQDDEEKIHYLQRVLGCSLYPEIKTKIIWFLYGHTTNNGKSTLMETICKALGSYAASIEPQTLAQAKNNNGGMARPDIARLAGVRFTNISEPPKRMLLDVALTKKLTGNDTITARRLYEDEFEFVPQFKMFMHCNSLPVVVDETLFTSDRVRIIEFNRHFSEQEQNKNLMQELHTPEVLSSVLNWLLEGLKDYMENGEQPPECVKLATSVYERQSDKIMRFVEECMVKGESNTSGADAYRLYCSWCTDNGYSADKKSIFFSSLRERGLMKDSGTIHGKGTVKNVIIGYSISEDV